MTEPLTIDDVAGVKLVDPDYFLSLDEVRQDLERAFQQGSQGWGVKREDAILLTIAAELRVALSIAVVADANHRMLKGAQMQNGKLQKKVEQLSAEILAKDIQAQELRDAIAARETSIKSLQEQLDEALTTRVPLHEQEPQTKITAHDEVDSEESS